MGKRTLAQINAQQESARKAYNERQKAKGYRTRTYRLTDAEHVHLKEYLRKYREKHGA